jgi:hypothetical protein
MFTGEDSIEVRVEDEAVWLTQKMLSQLFDVNVRTISEHLQTIFASEELLENSVVRNFRNTAADGKQYKTNFYNLDAIIAIGYRVNRKFYQKIADIYATSLDYNKYAVTSKAFFAKVHNKLHYALHGHTAAELVVERADRQQPYMGLTSWANAPEGKILKTDVVVAKNYLSE